MKDKVDTSNLESGGERKPNQGSGRNQGDNPGAGPGGYCICPKCKYKVAHETDKPCNKMKCPKCGATMTRETKNIEFPEMILPMRVIETTKIKD